MDRHDGQPPGSPNARQHWITRGSKLYLRYGRRGANNDHVFRNRAPVFIAEVDPDKLHIRPATERILLSETGLDLTDGFAPEMGFPSVRQDEENRVLRAWFIWGQP